MTTVNDLLERDYKNREFDTGGGYTSKLEYIQSVYPEHVRSHARQILENVDAGYKRYNYAAALAEHVHKQVTYSFSDSVSRADFLLDHKQKGDCKDYSTCIASLLDARSFDTRYVVLERDRYDRGHVFLQVLFEDADISRLIEAADSYYDRDIRKVGYEKDENGYWLVVDGTASPVVGFQGGKYSYARRSQPLQWKHDVRKDYLYVDLNLRPEEHV